MPAPGLDEELRLAPACQLDATEAARVITGLVERIVALWDGIADEVRLSDVDRRLF